MDDFDTDTLTDERQQTARRSREPRELLGTVKAILWTADDSSFIIARLSNDNIVKGPVEGRDALTPGATYRFLGRWEDHHKHGEQFTFATFVQDTPHELAGVVKYLVDVAPGIGRKRAEHLWREFGGRAVEILRTDPLQAVFAGVLGQACAMEASEALKGAAHLEHTKIDLFSLFAQRGFPGTIIGKAIQKWGARAAEIIRRDPFKLLTNELPGCGFKRTDRLYLDTGRPPARLKRQFLCLWNHLRDDGSGHTWIRATEAARSVVQAVGKDAARPVPAARLGKRARWLASWRDDAGVVWLAESEKARNEWTLSERLLDLLGSEKCRWPTTLADGVSGHQREVTLARVLTAPVGILAGNPGTGKSYTAAAIIRQLGQLNGWGTIAVCAPTGKAAVRITEAMGSYQIPLVGKTIHRTLKVQRNGHDGKGWGFHFNKDNPLPFQFIIVDETSMCDVDILAALLSACNPGTHILFIGDCGQLPPVGHGAPLRDMVASGAIPFGELTEIHRQGGHDNLVVEACAAIKAGRSFRFADRYNPDTGDNLRLVPTETAEESLEALIAVLDRFRQSGRFDPIWETQVLVAVNEKSELCRHAVNRLLQAQLNPAGKQATGNPFRVDDKIICLRNSLWHLVELKDAGELLDEEDPDSYQDALGDNGQGVEDFLANGETGRVLAVGPRAAVVRFLGPERTIRIPMGRAKDADGDGESKEEGGGNGGNGRGIAGDFDLAYAISVHKSQGSEWSAVIVLIDDAGAANRVTSREWWLTACSRAKKLCVLIGRQATLDKQRKKMVLKRRKTFLKELLCPRSDPQKPLAT